MNYWDASYMLWYYKVWWLWCYENVIMNAIMCYDFMHDVNDVWSESYVMIYAYNYFDQWCHEWFSKYMFKNGKCYV